MPGDVADSSAAGHVQIPLRDRDGSIVAHTLIDEQDAALADFRWYLNGRGYAARWVRGRIITLHRVVMNAPPGVEVDHINRNRLDNRRCNLRFADRGGNARNCSRNRKNTSGYKGVHKVGRKGRWGAAVVYEGGNHWLGIFGTAQEAAVTYDLAAMALHGEFAATNFSYPGPLLGLDDLRSELIWAIRKRLPRWNPRVCELRDRKQWLEASVVNTAGAEQA